jgi:AcrR family transcriptional regulator
MSRPRRGRPPDPQLRRKALAAARSLLDEGGVAAVTMEAVAARAGVGKPSLYRNWPNAQALAMAALMSGPAAGAEPAEGGDPLTALRGDLQALARRFASPAGRNAAMLLATAEAETELTKAFRSYVVMTSREAARRRLQRATAEDRLRPAPDLEVVLDIIFGPLFFRLLMGHAALDAGFVDAVLDHALAPLARR